MARRPQRPYEIHLEPVFDRLLAAKLAQVYDILVPEQVRRTGVSSGKIGETHEDGSHLRTGILHPAEGGENHQQPDSGAGGVRQKRGVQRTG